MDSLSFDFESKCNLYKVVNINIVKLRILKQSDEQVLFIFGSKYGLLLDLEDSKCHLIDELRFVEEEVKQSHL